MTFSGEVVGRKNQPEANGGGVGAIVRRRGSCRADGRVGAAERSAVDGFAIVMGLSGGF